MYETDTLSNIVSEIQIEFSGKAFLDLAALPDEKEVESRLTSLIKSKTSEYSLEIQDRIRREFLDLGPIHNLLNDEEVTEIIVNGRNSIWCEKHGQLLRHPDIFLSELTFRNAIRKLCRFTETQITLDHPYASGAWNNHRLQIVGPPIAKEFIVTLRAHPRDSWTLQRLREKNWCSEIQAEQLSNIVRKKQNTIIIGPTGAGKTSALDACLNLLEKNERAVILEDTAELSTPNESSTKLLTRVDPQNLLPPVQLSDLLRHSMRLRPDRLVLGEVRGPEAKDLMLALATGHSGSLGTLHASSAQEALLRLEMLVQLGAPQWSHNTVRRLIHLSLHYIVVAQRDETGRRFLEGIYKLSSLEEFGFLVEKIA